MSSQNQAITRSVGGEGITSPFGVLAGLDIPKTPNKPKHPTKKKATKKAHDRSRVGKKKQKAGAPAKKASTGKARKKLAPSKVRKQKIYDVIVEIKKLLAQKDMKRVYEQAKGLNMLAFGDKKNSGLWTECEDLTERLCILENVSTYAKFLKKSEIIGLQNMHGEIVLEPDATEFEPTRVRLGKVAVNLNQILENRARKHKRLKKS